MQHTLVLAAELPKLQTAPKDSPRVCARGGLLVSSVLVAGRQDCVDPVGERHALLALPSPVTQDMHHFKSVQHGCTFVKRLMRVHFTIFPTTNVTSNGAPAHSQSHAAFIVKSHLITQNIS